mgnify:CR=1 FL=1
MRKIPPVPEPPGQAYCFVCAQLRPESAFPYRNGRVSRPCRDCRRTAADRNAPIRAALEEAYQRTLSPPPPRPYEVPVSGACACMAGFAEWHEKEQRTRKAACKGARGAPKDHPPT